MPTFVFPVEITMDDDLSRADEAQAVCIQIEDALNGALAADRVVALQPHRGTFRYLSTDK